MIQSDYASSNVFFLADIKSPLHACTLRISALSVIPVPSIKATEEVASVVFHSSCLGKSCLSETFRLCDYESSYCS